MPAKFLIKVAKDGQFYFSLLSSEGKKLLASELYKAKASAYNGIASIRKNAGEAVRYDRLVSKNEKCYFTLKAANHEIIGVSDLFETEEQREDALFLVMLEAAGAEESEENPEAKAQSKKAEVLKTLEARKLNKRTMRPISSMTVVIPYGAIVSELKEEDRRLQFTYLGHSHSLFAPWIDYRITDRVSEPDDWGQPLLEARAFIPASFYPYDTTRNTAGIAPSRAALGLPQSAFVLCGFTRPEKIEPRLFERWLDLLHALPAGVLWLGPAST